MTNWQPIETAPKTDSFDIDLWVERDGQPGYRQTDCYWCRYGWWFDQHGNLIRPEIVTHWMHTPEPPND